MKPMLTLETLLGGPPAPAALRGRGPSDEEMAHRLVQIVWANGEALDTAVPTRGTALLQHGFKEWSAARGVTVPEPDAAGLVQAVMQCEDQNWTPLVLCRTLDGPLQVLTRLLEDGPCGLLALGTPLAQRLLPRGNDLARAMFPLRLPGGLDPALCAWLGAPAGLPSPALRMPSSLRVADRDLNTATVAQQLRRVERHWCLHAPSRLWCVLFLDDVDLGDHSGQAGSLAPEVLAATLRWLQRQQPWAAVFLVSHERVTAAQRGSVAELARHLGRVLFRHAGVAREAFPQDTQLSR